MNEQLSLGYRPCVGMMVINEDGLVLVGQRMDAFVEAWQMPQGGIDAEEDPHVAALRELREEIGTDDVTYLAHIEEWLSYDLPESLRPKLWHGKYRGQTQRWFLFRLNATATIYTARE
jgi:putative (di)nucleoside polyphosphate hydrolase